MRSHRIADVAEQAGLSPATVDRALHGRPGASPRAVRAVEQAVAELDRQAASVRLGARSLVLDVVVQAPDRFSGEVRSALESHLTGVRPAAVRARFHLRESGTVEDLLATLDGIGRRGAPATASSSRSPTIPASRRRSTRSPNAASPRSRSSPMSTARAGSPMPGPTTTPRGGRPRTSCTVGAQGSPGPSS